MIYQKKMGINIMEIDSTFWVAVSFIIFLALLVFSCGKKNDPVYKEQNSKVSDIKLNIV